jgi:hypothetical protein
MHASVYSLFLIGDVSLAAHRRSGTPDTHRQELGGEGEGTGGDSATLRLTPRRLINVSAKSGREVGETRSGRETEIVSVLSP